MHVQSLKVMIGQFGRHDSVFCSNFGFVWVEIFEIAVPIEFNASTALEVLVQAMSSHPFLLLLSPKDVSGLSSTPYK